MGKSIRHDKFLQLRAAFPVFRYDGFEYDLGPGGLKASFHFRLGEEYRFSPSFLIPRKSFFLPDALIQPHLPSLVFNIGMIELISYWKAACPPVVEVNAGRLTKKQAEWWKELYFNGLGEFFYLNGIPADKERFLSIVPADGVEIQRMDDFHGHGTLIPVGGGKDSAVTLELLGRMEGSLPIVMNPVKASLDCIGRSGGTDSKTLEIRRTLDPLLFGLNDQGFLNGHTPFSALLAFYSLLAAAVSGRKTIALSNESSANEPTIPGTTINHQYSKSFEFETRFREYVKDFLTSDIEYFSFLRPLHELQIARLFSKYPSYHSIFRSCNAGQKAGIWCGKCSKCLFTYIILSPFLPEEELEKIFGMNLFDDPDLVPYFDQLTGMSPEKPFDCVGTVGEVQAALHATIRKNTRQPMPLLLRRFEAFLPAGEMAGGLDPLLSSFDNSHYLPASFLDVLNRSLHD